MDSANPIRDLPVGDLDNDVHVIFQSSRFRWGGELLTDQEYSTLLPALLLASRLLTTAGLLGYWHAVFLSQFTPIRIPQPQPNDALVIYEYDTSFGFSPASSRVDSLSDIQRIRNQLEQLAENVCIQFCALPQNTLATYRLQNDRHKIRVDQTFLVRLSQANLTQAERRRMSFALAVVICHEIAHAAAYVATRAEGLAIGTVVFFPGRSISEDGIDWECSVFGGRVDLELRGNSTIIKVLSWPNRRVAQAYAASQYRVGQRELADTDQNEASPGIVLCVRKMFSTRFWETEVAIRGAEALKEGTGLSIILRCAEFLAAVGRDLHGFCSRVLRMVVHE